LDKKLKITIRHLKKAQRCVDSIHIQRKKLDDDLKNKINDSMEKEKRQKLLTVSVCVG
jgi:undecaprenyl pyrophosphate synthase